MLLIIPVALWWRTSLGDGRMQCFCSAKRCSTDGWGTYERHMDPAQPAGGTQHPQTIESTHSTLRTRIQRVVRRTMGLSTTTTRHDLVIRRFSNRYACDLLI